MIIKYAIRDDNGYISLHDYKQNREELYRARLWRDLVNVDKYLQSDSYRRLARYVTGDLQIQIIEVEEDESFHRRIVQTFRTIPNAQVQADAALASTRAERRARGLKR